MSANRSDQREAPRGLPLVKGASLLAMLLAIGSCSLGNGLLAGDTGAISLSIADSVARTLVPSFDMTPARYDLAGAGPGGRTFAASSAQTNVTISGLAFGQWSVTVTARNQAGSAIGQGSGTTSVSTGQQSSLSITVAPLPGNGAVHLSVTWVASSIQNPSLSAQLLPATGSALPLAFTLASGSATCDSAAIPAGYYTLTLQLMDNGIVVMGAVEIVRIVQGQTTSGSFDFTNSNQPGGAIAVSITPDLSNPLSVALSGQKATLAAGSSMTVTASVSGYTGNIAYVWYLNGQSQATGSSANPSLTLGGALSAGYYRLDVTAFSADGRRAGNSSAPFVVQ
jgi:hypothetical protein